MLRLIRWEVVIVPLLFFFVGLALFVSTSAVALAQTSVITKTSGTGEVCTTDVTGTGPLNYQMAFEVKLRLTDSATSKIKNLFAQNPDLAQKWKLEFQVDNKPVVSLQLTPVTSFSNVTTPSSGDAFSRGLGALSGNPITSTTAVAGGNRDYGLFQLLAQVEGSRCSGQLVMKDQTGSVVGRQPLNWSVPLGDYSLSGIFLFDQVSLENVRMDTTATSLKAGLPAWATDLSGQLSASSPSYSDTQVVVRQLPNPFMLFFFFVLFGGSGSLILINGFQVGLLQFKIGSKMDLSLVPVPASALPLPSSPSSLETIESLESKFEDERKKKFKFGKSGPSVSKEATSKTKKKGDGDKGTGGIYVGVAKGTGTGKGGVITVPKSETELVEGLGDDVMSL
ncbi:MAG: hypothetical protein HXX20_19285 [Chloroflexi bacterium]|nr:hypothetical protein [Chloroflexota bacterium]